MAKPRGSKKKGSAPAARKPSQAPDPGGITKSMLGDNVARLAKLERDKDESVSAVRGLRKNMKGMGVDLEMMDLSRKFQKFDEATRMIKLQTLQRYLLWMNLLESGEEADLFNTSAPAMSNDGGDIADHKGRMAARNFAAADANPYSPGTSDYDAWEFARADEAREMERELSGGSNGAAAKKRKGSSTDATAEAAPVH